ncbi:exodeoxyribonuclease VII large subunit [Anaerosphaera multitolerans]|uniref:Exodeoxyribonuclease 7 large subunit n=1 Tax=Anaerosphaera multitolerans TaxID=2487351 RepID=A0A437S7D5_9FIRM|nr:exodeoxyribonuclease VII large subunit [Anaerosphaera multitolerans]RVU54956.1 exodeoxyribonuclease VII large subunit [Anaerosphaera multitolerans]
MSAIKVKELNKYIKKYIAMDYILSDIEVEGEISNFTLHSNGNIYFTLKDEYAKINSVMYSNDRMNLEYSPKDGDSVIVKGSVSVYEREGALNLYAKTINLNGIGNLYEEYLKLKDKLFNEGLFNEEDKKKIPYFPRRVGVITSPTGAAIRDIINVLTRRNNTVDIILYPANVQGDLAVAQLIKALNYFDENPVDVIIIGRGGGSLEELFSFNNEELARRIYNMKIPVISAVGHEVDYVITDFVSDLRAPTPSAAAELVSMSKEDLNNSLELLLNRMYRKLDYKIETEKLTLKKNYETINKNVFRNVEMGKLKLSALREKLILNSPKQNLNVLKLKLENSKRILDNIKLEKIIKNSMEKLDKQKSDLDFLILNILKRKKYNLIEEKTKLVTSIKSGVYLKNIDGGILKSARDIDVDEIIDIYFIDGKARARVENISLRSDELE